MDFSDIRTIIIGEAGEYGNRPLQPNKKKKQKIKKQTMILKF